MPLPDSLPVHNVEAYKAVVHAATFGFTTWRAFVRHRVGAVIPQLNADGRAAEHATVGGFVADLERRLAEGGRAQKSAGPGGVEHQAVAASGELGDGSGFSREAAWGGQGQGGRDG